MRFITTILLSLLFTATHADIYQSRSADGSISYSDKSSQSNQVTRLDRKAAHKLGQEQFPGTWKAASTDGTDTTLTLRDDGSFVIDQRTDSSLHRLYMCGEWQQQEDALAFIVKAYKKRMADGQTEQVDGTFATQAPILSARRDRLIVQFEGKQLVFDRS